MTQDNLYNQAKEKILGTYNYAQGVIDTIQCGGAGLGGLAALGKYILDSTPDNFTQKERLFYAGAIGVGAGILALGSVASKINNKVKSNRLEKEARYARETEANLEEKPNQAQLAYDALEVN